MKRLGFIDGRRIRGFALSGSTALTGQNLAITDTTITSSGYSRGIHIDYTSSGAKTGGYTMPLAISFTISGPSTGSAAFWGQYLYISTSGNPVLDYLVGYFMYMDDPGSNAQHIMALRLNMNVDGGATGITTFFSLRKTGSESVNNIMNWEGSSVSTYFIRQDTRSVPFVSGPATGDSGDRLRCLFGPTIYYIPLHVAS